MKENLLILGAGQFGLMVKEIAEHTGLFAKIDFLDDNNPIAIGGLADYEMFLGDYQCAVVAIGNPHIRFSWLEKLEAAGFRIATLVSPAAYVSPTAVIGRGTIVEPMAVLQANSTVLRGCIVSSGAVIRHDAYLEELCHVDCNAVVMSQSVVLTKTKVNASEVYR